MVMCTGTFDIIHKGHLYYLTQAKKYGKELIVVVARDKTSEAFKGRMPINNERKRLKAVKKLKIVNKAVLGHHGNIFDIIEEIKPDVICLGYDQKIAVQDLRKELKKRGIRAKVVRLEAYKPYIYKSSKILRRIKIR